MNAADTKPVTERFYEQLPAIRAMRIVMRGAQMLGGWVAVPLAQRLFLTPIPKGKARPLSFWGDAWTQDRLAFENATITIYQSSATSKQPLTLIVHGWAGSAAQMRRVADALVNSGQAAALVEMPAHGGNAGKVSAMPQFARALEFAIAHLRAKGYRVQAIVAHSLGCGAAAYVSTRDASIERLAFIAPPASPQHYTEEFAKVFGLSEINRAAMQRSIEKRYGMQMESFEPHIIAPKIQALTLVMHDENDSVNPIAFARTLSGHIARVQWHETQGLGHNKIVKDPVVLARIASFLA